MVVALLLLTGDLAGGPAWVWMAPALVAGLLASVLARWPEAFAGLDAGLLPVVILPLVQAGGAGEGDDWLRVAGAALTAGSSFLVGWGAGAIGNAAGRLRWLGLAPILALAALGAIMAVYSEELSRPAPPGELAYDLRVLAAGDGTVTISADELSREPGTWGLDWEGRGYAQVGAILSDSDDRVVRRVTPIEGAAPRPGTAVAIDRASFPGDPREAFDLPLQEVEVPTELGPRPAWYVPGRRSTWAIMVHGRGASRRETMRLIPTLAALGMPVLSITYRGDGEGPEIPDDLSRLGAAEWRDLDAALALALRRGARDVVVVGYSMGGALTVALLRQSPRAARARAVILDAPVLEWAPALEQAARNRSLPAFLGRLGQATAAFRSGIDFSQLDALAGARQLRAPILLIHGTDDDEVPIGSSDALAAARPDLVTYLRVPGAGHTGAWNADRRAYERGVRRFLARVAPG